MQKLARIIDVLAAPFTVAGAWLLWLLRRIGVERLPLTRKIFELVGVFPIRDYYYEPSFRRDELAAAAGRRRELPGIDFNVGGQLALVRELRYVEELLKFPLEGPEGVFHFHNRFFESGDAEFLYSVVRHFTPRRIVEIGSGYSTLITRAAIEKNKECGAPDCRQVCIEPFENPWLTGVDVELVRHRVQDIGTSLFDELEDRDILSIDSSHTVRPGGDVLHEVFELFPRLRPGVLIHVHDVFTPRDYPRTWMVDRMWFWHEQYVLEGFLSFNDTFEVIGALNLLAHDYPEELGKACPIFASENGREPGSFWFRRRRTAQDTV